MSRSLFVLAVGLGLSACRPSVPELHGPELRDLTPASAQDGGMPVQDTTGAFDLGLVPFGDGRGGFAWMSGRPVTGDGSLGDGTSDVADTRSSRAIDALHVAALALGSAEAPSTWRAAALRGATRVDTAGLHAGALAQGLDRQILVRAMHSSDPAASAEALGALERLAAAGSPDATLALLATARLVGRVPADRLARASRQIGETTKAWLRLPFDDRSASVALGDRLPASYRRHMDSVLALAADPDNLTPDVVRARQELAVGRFQRTARLLERRRLWSAAVALAGP